MNRVFIFCFQNCLSLIRQSLKPHIIILPQKKKKKNSVGGMSMFSLPHFFLAFFFEKFPNMR